MAVSSSTSPSASSAGHGRSVSRTGSDRSDGAGLSNGTARAHRPRDPVGAAILFHTGLTGSDSAISRAGHFLDPSQISADGVVPRREQRRGPDGPLSNTQALDRSLVNGGSPALIAARTIVGLMGGADAQNEFDGLVLDGLRDRAAGCDAAGRSIDAVADPGGVLYGGPDALPSSAHIAQGAIGDCFLLSTLGAVADARPSLITNAIAPQTDGSYVVTLHALDANNRVVAVPVRVTPDELQQNIAIRGGSTIDDTGHGAAWPSVMEVAYAKLLVQTTPGARTLADGYRLLDQGGDPRVATLALTGETGDAVVAGQVKSADAFYDQLEHALAARDSVVLGALPETNGKADGLIDHHAYMVEGVHRDRKGVEWVDIRNPYGTNRATGGDTHPELDFEGANSSSAVISVRLDRVLANKDNTFFVTDLAQAEASAMRRSVAASLAPAPSVLAQLSEYLKDSFGTA